MHKIIGNSGFFVSQILPHIITLIITLVAAFSGAWFAFLLSKYNNDKIKNKDKLKTLNEVQILLIQQWNDLENFQKNYIEPARERADELLWMHLEEALYAEPLPFDIAASNLHFLLDSNNEKYIQEIFLERNRYKLVLQIMNQRSRVHKYELQPKFEEYSNSKVECKNIEEIEQFFGERITSEMKSLTENLVENLDSTIETHRKLITKLHSIGKDVFPKEKVINLKPIDLNK